MKFIVSCSVVLGYMGQGYSTKERQIFVPAKPVTFDDQPLPEGPEMLRAGSMHGGSVNKAASSASDEHRKPRRQSQNFTDPRMMSIAPGNSHRPGAGGAGAPNNDGEWMYNLDQLAHEHSKRKRRSVVKHHE